MQLFCNGIVRDDDLNIRITKDKINSFYYILIAASIYLHNNNPLNMYDDELDLCADLIYMVEKFRKERMIKRK